MTPNPFHPPTMPPEGIPTRNTYKVGKYLKEISGRATRWTAKAEHITEAARRATALLIQKGLSSENFAGATAVYFTGGPNSPAYRQAVAGTRAVLAHDGEGWRLMEARTVPRRALERAHTEVTLSSEQINAIAAVANYRATGERADA